MRIAAYAVTLVLYLAWVYWVLFIPKGPLLFKPLACQHNLHKRNRPQ